VVSEIRLRPRAPFDRWSWLVLRARQRLIWPTIALLAAACDGGTTPEPPLEGSIEVSLQIEGAGLSGIQIRLEDLSGVASPRFAVTDDRGTAEFEGLEEGSYDVSLGQVPDHVTVDVQREQASLARRRPAARINFSGSRKRDASVSVRVEVDGQGIPDVTVALSGPEDRSAITDIDGLADFEGLLRGHYEVALTGYDPERLAFGATSGGLDANGTQSIGIEFAGTEVPRVPDAPGDFTAEVVDPFAVDLSWTDLADNEEGFHIERRLGAEESWSVLGSLDPDAVGYRDTGTLPATDYAYRLRACNEHGCSEPWIETSASTPDVPPAAPTELAAAATGSTEVAVTWADGSSNELRFDIERRVGTDGPFVAVVSLGPNAVAWSDTGLATGTAYGYRVRACNAVGCSSFTGPVSATTVVVPPAPPASLAAVAEDHDRIRLSWIDASPDETAFRLERRVGSASWMEREVLPAGSTSRLDPTVSGSTTYSYRLRACNAAGCSDYSNVASTTTPVPPPNLMVGAAYIVQRVQRPDGGVPLIDGLDGLLRIFPLADRAGIAAQSVLVEFYQGGALVQSTTIPPPVATMPTGVNESSLATSWNLPVPAAMIQPGLGLRITVDPTDAFAEGDETDNTFPSAGPPQALDVRTTPDFEVTFVPVRQSVNNTVGDVDTGNADSYLSATRRMMPFANDDIAIHAEFVTDQPVLGSDGTGWSAVLSEVAALRTAEGSSRAYFGVVPTTYGGGVAGIGYIGWPISLGWDRSGSRASVAAHEWGHNFGRRHSPGCGAGNPDTSYPHANGATGAWGLDYATSTLKSPQTYFDLMTYCSPEWISDYVYEEVLQFRGPAPMTAIAQPATSTNGLLVWGRIEADSLVLEPAFEVAAPTRLPDAPGRYRVEGRDATGSVFMLSFDPVAVADGAPGTGHFAFVVPLSAEDRGRLREIRLADGQRTVVQVESASAGPLSVAPIDDTRVVAVDGNAVDVHWNAARHPMVLVRDVATGEILSFARGGHVRLHPPRAEIEIILSNGVGTADRRTARWR
jgi:hypothetical protein